MNELLQSVLELRDRFDGCINARLDGPNKTAYGCLDKPLTERCEMCLAETIRLKVIEDLGKLESV